MDSERWNQVDKLLESALERDAAERDAFLRHACVGDGPLEQEVRSLLAHTTAPAASSVPRRLIGPHATSPNSAAAVMTSRPPAIR